MLDWRRWFCLYRLSITFSVKEYRTAGTYIPINNDHHLEKALLTRLHQYAQALHGRFHFVEWAFIRAIPELTICDEDKCCQLTRDVTNEAKGTP